MMYACRKLALCVLCAAALCGSSAMARNRPSGLMTDLITDAGAVYRDGCRLPQSVADIAAEDSDDCRFAVVRSSRPTFGWIVPDCGRGTHQRKYRIIVSDNIDDAEACRGNVWDSGFVRSSQSVAVPYGGDALHPDKLYFWRVAVSTTTGGRSEWSDAEPFRTASVLSDYAPSYRMQICECDEPREVRRLDASTVSVEFGRVSFGSLELTLQSPEGGDTIHVAIGEAAKEARIDTRPPGTVRYYRYPLILGKGTRTYRVIPAPDARNTGPQAVPAPDYLGEVAPFRYCQIECGDDIAVERAVRRTTVYPFDYDAAQFSSDDPVLDSVWELCKYTIKATSAFGIYVDGDRERIPYEADALINQLGHYAVDREYAMARRTSEYLLYHPTWPTEWILQALIIAWNDYLYTGDLRSIETHYELLKSRTLLTLRRGDGLISTTADKTVATDGFRRSINFGGTIRDIVDWPHGSEEDGFVFTDRNCVVNAFHYRALQLLARMARLTERTEEARALDEDCRQFRQRFNDAFFDPDAGTYRDGRDTGHYSLHSAMFAMAFGLVPEEHRDAVLSYIRSRDMACSVYGAQFLLDAAYDAGDSDYGLYLLTKRDRRSWYNMLAHDATLTYEAWDDSFKPNQDWNHAWGAAPANVIMRRLVGVRPLVPGCGLICISPQTSSLRHVEATVPTIRGGVKVAIDNAPGCYRLKVCVPPNTSACVVLPVRAEQAEVRCNGRRRAWSATERGFVDAGKIASGEYEFEVKYRPAA